MEKYSFSKVLGDGTYGTVYSGTVKDTGNKVAIKKMKKNYYSWEECLELREVRALRKLNHANIVKLKELIRENDVLYFIFEHMNGNLYELMKSRPKGFTEANIKTISFQMLSSLGYLHRQGFFHRDIKPENFLYTSIDCIKLADFGLAREIRSRPPFSDYVSTRWYRSPELLLRSTNYGAAVDIWAVGCIIIELYNMRPIFPGTSEIDQLFKICTILGTPSKTEWPDGFRLSTKMNFKWPTFSKVNLTGIVRKASAVAINLLETMMSFNPENRPSAITALRSEFLQCSESVYEARKSMKESRASLRKSKNFSNDLIYATPKESPFQARWGQKLGQNEDRFLYKRGIKDDLLPRGSLMNILKADTKNYDSKGSKVPEFLYPKSNFSEKTVKKNSFWDKFNENSLWLRRNNNPIRKISDEFKDNQRLPVNLPRPHSFLANNRIGYIPSMLDNLPNKSIYSEKKNVRHVRRLNPIRDIFDK